MRIFVLVAGLLVIAYGSLFIGCAGSAGGAIVLGGVPLLLGIALIIAAVSTPKDSPLPSWAETAAGIAVGLTLLAAAVLAYTIWQTRS